MILFRLRPDSWKEIGDQFQMNKYSSMSSVIERVTVLLVKDRRLKDTVETLMLRLSKSQEQI